MASRSYGVYDVANPIQELSGTTPTFSYLTSGLGSTLGLADVSGTVQTGYSYGAFGNPTSTGAANSNAIQYTGRETDGTGLQYIRTHYYSPTLQRFISQDSLCFGGGDSNLYNYIGNDPVNATVATGLIPVTDEIRAPNLNEELNSARSSPIIPTGQGGQTSEYQRWIQS